MESEEASIFCELKHFIIRNTSINTFASVHFPAPDPFSDSSPKEGTKCRQNNSDSGLQFKLRYAVSVKVSQA
jgi:hypothetical protein